MLVGVPKEIKNHEYRVGMVPGSVRELIHHGHQVVVESNGGAGIGFEDEAYRAVGADIQPLDLRAQQRHAAFCPGLGQQGIQAGTRR